jgi:pimeloyl-ACP methyl ester carboxylesterase
VLRGADHRPDAAAVRPSTRLVAVPGLGLVPETVRRVLGSLATPSAAVSLPAYGRRAARRTALEPARLAEVLLAHLAAPTGPAVLVGHSASCQIVAEVAARVPDRVAGLVLVGPTTDPRAATWPGLVRRWLRTAVHERPGQLPLLVRAYARSGLGSMARGMDAARRHRLDRVLAAVHCPVLVVRGPHDAICPADWAAALAAATPEGRAETLPAGAHMVPITHPAALAGAITAFLATLADG